MAKSVVVTKESGSGRNLRFHNKATGMGMNRIEFVRRIDAGNFADYHIRNVNGLKTPASNPDKRKSNNLG